MIFIALAALVATIHDYFNGDIQRATLFMLISGIFFILFDLKEIMKILRGDNEE